MYIDNAFFCYTLEDKDRNLETNPEGKVYGKSAIPRGTYQVIVDYSQRFKKLMPRLIDVPGFSGVRIHPGNYAADTDGCILVGIGTGRDVLFNSRAAYEKMMQKFEAALDRGETIELEIV
jgi:hypothetical protein